jgi:hypothetical protein
LQCKKRLNLKTKPQKCCDVMWEENKIGGKTQNGLIRVRSKLVSVKLIIDKSKLSFDDSGDRVVGV